MDVNYINPFLNGTLEVLKKMAFLDAVPGKPSVKRDETAFGDVSGIIGITGDALGSLALSFSEACICRIVANMLGEEFREVNREIIDATGELTNMVSGASRTQMEKMGMNVYAAIPTVVHGRHHTISHILKSPSIVIPFSTPAGPFFVDVCVKALEESERAIVRHGVVNVSTPVVNLKPAASPSSPAVTPAALKTPADTLPEMPRIDIRPNRPGGLGKSVDFKEAKEGAAARLAILKSKLKEATAARNAVQNQLRANPFVDVTKRQRMRNEIAFHEKTINRIKSDILGLEMIAKMSLEDLENPKVTKHYQNYDDRQKR